MKIDEHLRLSMDIATLCMGVFTSENKKKYKKPSLLLVD